MEPFDIVVIGGGLIGCASACHLSRAGARVLLLERGQINQGASGRNAGSLHFQLEYRLIQDTSLKASELEFYVGLAQFAVQRWKNIHSELDDDVEVHMDGGLMVAESREQIAVLERKAKIEQSQGLNVQLVDGDEARRIAPYLSSAVLAALHCPDEGHCNPRLLTPAYARTAAKQGAQVRTGAEVTALRRTGGHWQVEFSDGVTGGETQRVRCDVVLNAAGVSAPDIGAMANVHLPLLPVGLTMNATEKVEPIVPHLVQHVGRRLSLKQTADGNLLVGGGWSARLHRKGDAWSTTQAPAVRIESVRGNLRAAADVVPRMRSLRLLRTWTGMTAVTPDQLPVLGEVPQAPGFFVAAGGSGFTYGPSYGLLMSERILTGSATSYSLDPFSPARFGGINGFMGLG